MNNSRTNPAILEAIETYKKIEKNIDNHTGFLVEAGAGAGKTTALIRTLKLNNQKIACITYTNVAVEEIQKGIDKNPLVFTSTIHGFCWALIQKFQSIIRKELMSIPKWNQKLKEENLTNFGTRKILYLDIASRKILDDRVLIWHDDVLTLMTKMLVKPKFRLLLSKKYPIILIDEYQDSNADLIESINEYFLEESSILVGYFGDPWQKIYRNGCGKINHPNSFQLKSNFRSAPQIVEFLNKIRPSLNQVSGKITSKGSVTIWHTNNWKGERLEKSPNKGDLPFEIQQMVLNKIKSTLEENGWDFSNQKTKILMLTHKSLAIQQGYSTILTIFHTDLDFIVEKPHVKFLLNVIEPVCNAYKLKQFGQMYNILSKRRYNMQKNKKIWISFMDELINKRETGLIGEVFDHIMDSNLIIVPNAIESIEKRLNNPEESVDNNQANNEILEFKKVYYKEIINLYDFVENNTPFSTKHGVKGAEFENVICLLGRGWNLYNWNNYLEWLNVSIPKGKEAMFERTRNLFYVICSRPKLNLSLIFTQRLSSNALSTLKKWVKPDELISFPFEDFT